MCFKSAAADWIILNQQSLKETLLEMGYFVSPKAQWYVLETCCKTSFQAMLPVDSVKM